MGWPYDKRADPVHAWGAIAAGIAIAAAIYAARALDPHAAKSWGWPTNWMIIPLVVIGIGLILLVLPILRARHEHPAPLREEPAQPNPPESTTLTGVDVAGNAQLTIHSSAERFAEATRFLDDSQVTVRHLPGRADILADGVRSLHGQEGQTQGEGAAGATTREGERTT